MKYSSHRSETSEYNHIIKSLILNLEMHCRVRERLCEPIEEFISQHEPYIL